MQYAYIQLFYKDFVVKRIRIQNKFNGRKSLTELFCNESREDNAYSGLDCISTRLSAPMTQLMVVILSTLCVIMAMGGSALINCFSAIRAMAHVSPEKVFFYGYGLYLFFAKRTTPHMSATHSDIPFCYFADLYIAPHPRQVPLKTCCFPQFEHLEPRPPIPLFAGRIIS